MHPEDLQLLVTRTMPFGKYKGRIDHNGLIDLLKPLRNLAKQPLQHR